MAAGSPAVCISFICQAGELELKALLLAASLRRFVADASVDLVAAIPDEALWGEVSTETRAMLERLQVRTQPVDSPFGEAYPIGNKIAALGVPTEADVSVFLDSDILCLDALDPSLFATTGFLAKPADFNTYPDPGQWQSAYVSVEVAPPVERVLSTVSEELMWPYFNAGVVAVADGPAFSAVWLEVAKALEADETVVNKRPWLDQIALPIAARKMGYGMGLLPEALNFPAHFMALHDARLPLLCHYHWPEIIEQEPVLSQLLLELCQQHPELRTQMGRHPEWARLLQGPYAQQERRSRLFQKKAHGRIRKDFLLTGMPRSGTSLLCNLLHKMPDTVIINEPREIFPILGSDRHAHGLGIYYRKLRTDILVGEPIENKLTEAGEVTEDTRLEDVRRVYRPEVSSRDFWLGTKNPLAYLARLRLLCDEYPDMPKLVTVRNPVDVILSWKDSFVHLQQVDLEAFPFAGEDDPLLDGLQRKCLGEIRAEQSPTVRQALLWRYLSELIAREQDRITLVRYEDLVAHPAETLKRAIAPLGRQKINSEWVAGVSQRARRAELSDEELSVVRLICAEQAAHWGYEV